MKFLLAFWVLLFSALFVFHCDGRTSHTVQDCQDKCGELADSCVKGDNTPDIACIDAYARCVVACGGTTPTTAAPVLGIGTLP